ncbi:MAG: putative sulfate exporter family transporter [Myxococcales bacterium]|nr:putative sulfate exporter family transporter [Myxococcales bacterium]
MPTPTGSERNLYADPEVFRWAGSMEGVPDASPSRPLPWREGARELLAFIARVLPGVAIAVVMAYAATGASQWLGVEVFGFERSPLSPILFAILLGLAIRNAIGIPAAYDEGLRFCLQRLLRLGVALLGMRLSLAAVGAIGLAALPIVVASITTAILLVGWVNRALGLPPRLGTLVAVGTAICGNSAIVAAGPAIGAKEDEISYAVGCVTLFGLIALLVYPFLSHGMFDGDPTLVGLFLGTAIHDTAQVAGAGMLYLQQYGVGEVLDTATVTKLLRNLFMIAVIPGMAYLHQRREHKAERLRIPAFRQAVPMFVLGFLALALLRTLGDLSEAPFGGAIESATWGTWIGSASALSGWLLAIAMAAVGLGTDLRRLRSLGARPLLVGLAAALAVGGASAVLIRVLAPWIRGLA